MKRMLQQFVIRINEALQVDRTEMLQPNGDRIVTLYTNESRAPIDPAMFEFSPPDGNERHHSPGALAYPSAESTSRKRLFNSAIVSGRSFSR